MKSDIRWVSRLICFTSLCVLGGHPRCSRCSCLIPLRGCLIAHCTHLPQLHSAYPLIGWWTFGWSFAFGLLQRVLLWILVYRFLCSCLSSLGCIPKSGVTGDRAVSLLEESSWLFPQQLHHFAFSPATYEGSSFSTFVINTCYFPSFKVILS